MTQSNKKKLFISIHYLEIGGAEISLIGLLQSIDYSKYDVDLFLWSHRGELMEFIPKEVHLLPEIPEYAQIERPLKDVIKSGYLRIAFRRLIAKYKAKCYNRRNGLKDSGVVFQSVADSLIPVLPSINDIRYDLAISFLIPHNIVRDKVKAKKKICWIHTDYRALSVDAIKELPVWESFDNIVSISYDVSESFLRVFPTLKDRVIVISNILPVSFVRRRAEMSDVATEMPKIAGTVNLLSVGRFVYAKNYESVPAICRRILNKGIKVRWYLIGYGGREELIRSRIVEEGVKDNVIILGKKSNPYPYINSCDIYVQPSLYEGNSVTVREAQMLFKPVVITEYATARSQIQNDIDGVIVPLDNDGCAEGIYQLINNLQKRESIVCYLQNHDYGNEAEVKKLEALVG